MSTVVGLLLAAGAGRRFGGPKALATLPDGTGLLRRAVGALRDGGCAPIVVVLGAAAEQAQPLLATEPLARAVVNPDWASGMGSSLRAGLAALPGLAPAAVAALVLLVDTPGIGAAAVSRLALAGAPDVVAVGTYAGRRGHPVLLGRDHWPEVARLATGDQGARAFLRAQPGVREVPCDDISDPTDLDSPADVRARYPQAGPSAPAPDGLRG